MNRIQSTDPARLPGLTRTFSDNHQMASAGTSRQNNTRAPFLRQSRSEQRMMGQTLLQSGFSMTLLRKPNQADIQRDRNNRKLVERLTSVKSIFDPNGRELHEYQHHRRTCHLHQVFDDYMGRRCPPPPRPRPSLHVRPKLTNPCPTGSLDALLCPWDLPSKTSTDTSSFFSSALYGIGSAVAPTAGAALQQTASTLEASSSAEKAFAAPSEREGDSAGSEDKAAAPAVRAEEADIACSQDIAVVPEHQVSEVAPKAKNIEEPRLYTKVGIDISEGQRSNPEGSEKLGEALDFFNSGASPSKPTDFRSFLGSGDYKPDIKHSSGSALKPPDFRSSEGASTGSALKPPDFRSSEGASTGSALKSPDFRSSEGASTGPALKPPDFRSSEGSSAVLNPVDLRSSGGTFGSTSFGAGSSALQPPDFRSPNTQTHAGSVPDLSSDASALRPTDIRRSEAAGEALGSSGLSSSPGDNRKSEALGKPSSPWNASGSQQALSPPDFRSGKSAPESHGLEGAGTNLQRLDSKTPEAKWSMFDGSPQDSGVGNNIEATGSKKPDWLLSGQAASSSGNPKRAENDIFGDMFANLDGDKALKPPDFSKPKRRRG
eukprot:TRINITY_DN7733_c0_g1_i1.p1 TRINITY_DN7733_c0_g1~~TRINITY_DN7733_c0_g1_i1.p1  ORF type:complete len:602 (+),score=106.96 TRINITY_DN7733_c0_g1_i1:174-1979(+)